MTIGESKSHLDRDAALTPSMETIRVLHLDDEEQQQMFLKIFIESDPNIKVTSARNAEDTLRLIQTGAYDCLISDYDMPDMDGITLAKKIRETTNIPIIIYTGRGSEEVAEQAYSVGINDYIRKENHPAHFQVLAKRIKHVVEMKRAEKALRESEERYRTLVEYSPYAISVTMEDKIVYANHTRAKLADVDDPSKLIGASNQLQIGKADRKTITERRKMRERGEKPTSPFAFQLVNKDGSIRNIVDYSSEIVYNGNKAIQHMLMDVTEHKLYEERLEALHRIELELVGAETLDEVAELTLNAIESTLGFDRCGFGVVEGNMLQFHHNRGVEGVVDLPLSGGGITVRAVRTGETQSVPDVRVDDDYIEGVKSDYRALSEVVIPVRVGGDVVAVLNVESSRLDAYTVEDEKLLEILSEHVASAIQRIEFFKSMRRHTINLEALQRHVTNLLNTSTIDEVMRCTFDIIENVLGVTDSAIGFVEGDALIFPYAKNVSADQLPVLSLDGAGISVRAVRTGETQLVLDTQSDPDFVVGYGRTLSELDVPVKVGGRVVAVINLENPKPNAFSEEDKTVIEILSEHVASAISRIEQLDVIKASGERYRRLLESSFDGMILLSGTKIIYANTSEAKLLGYDSPSELIGLDVSATLPEDEYERVRQRTLRRQRGETEPNRYELRLRRKDGKTVEAEAATTLIEYDGKPAVLSVTRDISEVKRFERQVMALRDHAYTLPGTSSIEEVCQVTLDAVESVIGFHLGSFLVVKGNDLVSIGNRGSSTFGRPIPIDGKGITAKAAREKRSILVRDVKGDPDFLRGTTNSLSELAVPVILDGETVAVLNFESLELDAFDDVDQKLLETFAVHVSSAMYRIREMELAKEQSETKARELMDGAKKMVSMVRHDLRGPLQTIQNASYLISHRFKEAEKYTTKIDAAVEYAINILEDLKVMMGPSQLNKEVIDFNDLVKGCLGDANFASVINVEARYGAPVLAEVDSYKIRRVVDNLVKNAVEAMPDGGTLSVKVETVEGMALLTVVDTGCGIPEDVARNLFTPFYTTKSGGTGLGLVICKQIIEAHGGKMMFDSVVERGTTFTVTLPLRGMVPMERDNERVIQVESRDNTKIGN